MRGLESDPLPSPKQDASSDQTWWAGGNDGSAAGFGDAGRRQAGHEGRQRRQWGEPSTLDPLSFGANGSGTTKENRDPGTPPRGADAPSGRLMPWEREMLVKQAEQEATARGLPPTPSNEAIARVFGEYGEARDGDDPDVWGPPRPSPGKGPSLNRSRASPSTQRPASAAPRSPGAPTRVAASVTAGPRATVTEHGTRSARCGEDERGASDASDAAPENAHSPPMTKTKPSVKAAALAVGERASPPARHPSSSTKQPTTETTEAAGQPGRVRPAAARAGTTRARSPSPRLPFRGSPPRSESKPRRKGSNPSRRRRRGRRRLDPRRARGGGVRAGGHRRRAHAARRGGFRGGARRSRPPWTSPTGRTRGRWRRCWRVAQARGGVDAGRTLRRRRTRGVGGGGWAPAVRARGRPRRRRRRTPVAARAPRPACRRRRVRSRVFPRRWSRRLSRKPWSSARRSEGRVFVVVTLGCVEGERAERAARARVPGRVVRGGASRPSVAHAPAATPIGFDEFLKLQERRLRLRRSSEVAAEAPARPRSTPATSWGRRPRHQAAAARKVAAAKAEGPTAAGAAPRRTRW